MKQVILNIPDSSFDFFIELMKKLNFAPVDAGKEDIPMEVQQMVMERLKNSKSEELLTWEEVKTRLA